MHIAAMKPVALSMADVPAESNSSTPVEKRGKSSAVMADSFCLDRRAHV